MRPIAGLANRLGIKRISLDAQDFGGYIRAEAGALPQGSWLDIADVVRRRADRLRRRGEITLQLQDQIGDMLEAGNHDPRLIWAVARLPQEVKSTHARNPMDPDRISLGKELPIGVSWKAGIDLGKRFSRLAFMRWLSRGTMTRHENGNMIHPSRLSLQGDFDPLDLGVALAMRDNGFDDAQIRSVLGYIPDLNVTASELDAYEAELEASHAPGGECRQQGTFGR